MTLLQKYVIISLKIKKGNKDKMIDLIEEGSGLGFTTEINERIEQFRLVIIARKNWLTNNWDDYKWGYLNESNKYFTDSCYCGGNTGFGVHKENLTKVTKEWFKDNVLMTDDLAEMKAMAWDAERTRRKARENDIKQKEKIASKINELPDKFRTNVAVIDKNWNFIRSEASYSPMRSSSIQGANVYLESKKKMPNGFKKTVYLDQYVSRDGKLLVKSFTNDIRWLFGEYFTIDKKFDGKKLLFQLVSREKQIKQMIKDIK